MILKTDKKKSPTDYHRLIVSQFCEYEKGTYGAKLNQAIKAYAVNPDPEFWDWMFINCNFKVQCPSYFTTDEGLEFLQSKKKLMNMKYKDNLTSVQMYGKLGTDKEINKKKNLLDFIRDGKKEN
tara:strand:+ start:2304 stop:2675 length:372 start_codon:yes stop_codon:yes gene_type:complete